MESATPDMSRLVDAASSLAQQVPPEWQLGGLWPFAILLIVSVIIGLHGERLTRLLILAGFIALGAALGQRVAGWMALPLWPTVVLAGSLGGLAAHIFWRYAMGMALAVLLGAMCGAWSAGTTLDSQQVIDLFSRATAATQPSTEAASGGLVNPVADPAAAVKAYADVLEAVRDRGASLWQNMIATPEGHKHFLVMVLAGAGVGLLAGLVLGRLAAIVFTSVLAGAGTVAGLAGLIVRLQPEWGTWLSDNRRYVLAAAVTLAALYGIRQLSRPRTVLAAPPAELASSSDKS